MMTFIGWLFVGLMAALFFSGLIAGLVNFFFGYHL